MRRYRLGAHTKTDLKVHLIWIPKEGIDGPSSYPYSRCFETDRNGARDRDYHWESICRSYPYVHLVSSDSKHKQDHAVAERHKLTDSAIGVCTSAQAILGQTSLGQRISGSQLGQSHR